MNLRQIHLDFHTSEKINGIGKNFNREQFQKALILGNVNSITLFSKCHHGWAYHPTTANVMHPGLDFDLLGEQIKAAHEIGVKTPVYISAGIDEKYAVRHRNEIVRNKDESTTWVPDFLHPGYHKLCMNTPYLEVLLEQIKEVCKKYDADGIFLDIVGVQPCYCEHCMNQLYDEGKSPDNENAVIELAERVYKNYAQKVREAIDSVKPGLPVFHNSGHIRRGRRDLAFVNTHLELESLPTGGWGYDHFPLSAAYARSLGMEFIGMTGKFHKTWGEFGGFKHPNALRYEVALSAANGAGCSVGDQLHPSGEMDLATYSLIGEAYRELEEKEPWLHGAVNIADIGVFTTEAAMNYYSDRNFGTAQSTNVNESDSGCTRILLEGKYLFDAVDADSCFEKYKLLILPDAVRLDEALAKKLSVFMNNGGKLLLSGKSGLWTDKDEFALDIGMKFVKEAEYNPTYLKPEFDVSPMQKASYVIYEMGYCVENLSAEELAAMENPYFNRTIEHFCSHRHAPSNGQKAGSGILCSKGAAYIAWDIFAEYGVNGSYIVKRTVCGIIDRLLGNDKTIETSLPAQGIATLTKSDNKYIVHLLYASPVKRGNGVEVIEDIVPIYNTEVSVRISERVNHVRKVPEMTELEFVQADGRVSFVADKLENHQMIEIETDR